MAQIQHLNNNELIIMDPRFHQVSTVSHPETKKSNALKIKCFAVASLILIVLTVAVVVPLTLNRSQLFKDTKTTTSSGTTASPKTITETKTTTSSGTTTSPETITKTDFTQAPILIGSCKF
jgi:hypothetical protein